MQLQSRSYNPGRVFRPKPYILQRPENSLVIVTSSWSAQSEAEKVANLILEQIEQLGSDNGAMSGQERSQLPGEVARRLRHALTTTAQTLYRQDNQRQARLLVEAIAIQVQGHEINWAQVGQPNLYLHRQGRIATLSLQTDHSILDPSLPPLPKVGMGLEAQTTVLAGSAAWQSHDQLLLLAQSWSPAWSSLDPKGTKAATFQRLTAELIERQPELAFWCGLVSF